jgi:RimJ/RimL family protein N-acetyltransferase
VEDAPEEEDGATDDAVGAPVRAGELVRLRTHVPANQAAFQRWYADEEIAKLLRHDQEPLNAIQSRGYFNAFILPMSARGMCYAIHEVATDRLVGTSALTDVSTMVSGERSALFRIVIGEKDIWGRGYGTEATRLVLDEAFGTHGLGEVRLEVFRHNPRALATYQRVGFGVTGEHVEWVSRKRLELNVIELALKRDAFRGNGRSADVAPRPRAEGGPRSEADKAERQQRREERQQQRGDQPGEMGGQQSDSGAPVDRAERQARRSEREQRRSEREQRRSEREQRQGGDTSGESQAGGGI